jgi:hypothetical protein
MVYAYDIAYDFLYLAPQKPVQDFLLFFPFEEIVTAVFFPPDSLCCVYVYTYYTHMCVYVCTYIGRARFVVMKSPTSTLKLLCVCTYTQDFLSRSLNPKTPNLNPNLKPNIRCWMS